VDSQAIATWAEHQAEKSHRKPTKHLTSEEIGLLLKLRQDGLTQTEIAQRLDRDQAAISRWLTKLTDTTDVAKSYLRGSALRMAKNVVRTGQARDHIQALKGLRVLEEDGRDIKIAIGVSLPGLTIQSESSQKQAETGLGSDS
jgi:DNA-binding MarR family transcriptional regulator